MGGGCDQFLLPENISTYPRIILEETLWNYGQFSNKEMTEWSWALDFSICLLPALKKPRSSEFYEGDWFPWTPLDRSIDSLEPKILGWYLGHLRTPRSSKENTTRNIYIYSILQENIDCTLFPIKKYYQDQKQICLGSQKNIPKPCKNAGKRPLQPRKRRKKETKKERNKETRKS